ncbi:hypothetical protein JQU17_19800 [Ponticoccus sp. SC2-23]|uniref:hypothetical protein n=1 Tax=Alexandriicola marinus TaxID=2081710 RepID=UPI000FDCD7D5|nr:hypothetical protein [Alexandriicola marinus]MBM1222458.1 hypothetical protein [Ponticoccus sp. SC6-9]MBM1226964.1 hypothetical protein [Ponticoccus sp. SC6-15]MBM1231385.1 hypothetical protein [Ponticoccus sp. SC6-38]MBM1235958.1 hypothetical protein [Ponticoccus sp. SC6-45]MBM1240408.1 hypothetical protein [Ponticoccus sp. SC6-49]MBM1244943.1 hypothetical protein [Ponticoccus sp. SC2-64]MBM1249432.1 hypothetical protein [Ponticoccus sp. SC6-42]MBM1253901.1 hypothetical protein [Pontico
MEFRYHVDPRDGHFARIMSELVTRLHRTGELDFGLSESHDPGTTILLTNDPERFLDTRSALLFIGTVDPAHDAVLAMQAERVIVTSRSLQARIGLKSDQVPVLAELPAGPVTTGSETGRAHKFEIVHCSEAGGVVAHPLGKAGIAALPGLAMFEGLDLPCSIRLHLGDKPFDRHDYRVADTVASGRLAADLSFDIRSDCGDLNPWEVSGPIFGEARSLDNLQALYDCLVDPIFTSILLRRQQDLMPGFNKPREAAIRDILRQRTPKMIELLFRQAAG